MAARKLILLFIILLCVFLAVVAWWANSGKAFFKKEAALMAPKVHVRSLYISDIDDNTITIVGDAKIENTLPAELVIDSLDYDLYIDSSKVLQSMYTKKISIHRSDWGMIKLPMELNVKKLRALAKKFDRQEKDSAAYTLVAKFRMKVPVAGMRKFEIRETKINPAIKEIIVKPGKMNFDKMGLKKTKMSTTVEVENHNAFPLQMKDGVYKLEIKDGIEMNGTMQKTVYIPARGSGTVDMDINTKTLKLPKLGWKWLFREHHTHYIMHFTCIATSDNEMMRHIRIRVTDEGTLAEIKENINK